MLLMVWMISSAEYWVAWKNQKSKLHYECDDAASDNLSNKMPKIARAEAMAKAKLTAD